MLFDHVVHVVDNPEKMVDIFAELGLRVVNGGRHESWGTYNTLSYYGLPYIEFLGVFDKEIANGETEDHSLLNTLQIDGFQNGLSRIALRTERIGDLARHFRKIGLTVSGPYDMSRTKEDGTVVNWRLLYVSEEDGKELELPFFIQWDEKDDKRREGLIKSGAIGEHPSGNVKMEAVGIVVNHLDDTVEKWAGYFGAKAGTSFLDSKLNAKGKNLLAQNVDLIFYTPMGAGPVADILKSQGERPFLVEFSGAGKEATLRIKNGIYRFS